MHGCGNCLLQRKVNWSVTGLFTVTTAHTAIKFGVFSLVQRSVTISSVHLLSRLKSEVELFTFILLTSNMTVKSRSDEMAYERWFIFALCCDASDFSGVKQANLCYHLQCQKMTNVCFSLTEWGHTLSNRLIRWLCQDMDKRWWDFLC